MGNSFIYYNDLPAMVQQLSRGKLVCGSVTKGGAFAHQYADPDHELGQQLRQSLHSGKWDSVVLQDQSFNPVKDPADHLQAMQTLSGLARGARRYYYQTWAYKDGSEKLARTGLSYEQMHQKLQQSYAAAAKDGVLVPVGDAFALARVHCPHIELYNADCFHPSPAGSYLAACLFCALLAETDPLSLPDFPGLPAAHCASLRTLAAQTLA